MRIYQIEWSNLPKFVKKHKIPLRFLVSLGLVHLPIKFDIKFIFTPYLNLYLLYLLQYEQIRLDENFCQYFEGIIMSNKTLRTRIQKASYQKYFKINLGASSYKVGFTGANRLLLKNP